MTDGCRCGCSKTNGAVTAELTVAQVKDRPGALDVLQRFGLDHCCGAHLTLREAAALAGVELPVLLDALGEPAAAPTP